MRWNHEKSLWVGLIGPALVLVLTLAWPTVAQSDWGDQSDQRTPTYGSEFWPATTVGQPVANQHQRPVDPSMAPAAGGDVVHAGYDAPVQAPDTFESGKELKEANPAPKMLPPDTRHKKSSGSAPESSLPGGLERLWTTGGALALVLGLFFVAVWVMRRAAPRANLSLPSEAVEILGRAPLGNRQHVHLIRCGNKLLLVNVTADRAETLTEITDPHEVDRLTSLCKPGRSGSVTTTFRQVYDQYSQAGERPAAETKASLGRLFPNDRPGPREGRHV